MPKTKKAKYRVRNWKEYNKALVQRGSLTFWVDEKIRHRSFLKNFSKKWVHNFVNT